MSKWQLILPHSSLDSSSHRDKKMSTKS